MGFFNEPLLLVPIHVDALAVGTQQPDSPPDGIFQWTNLAPNFSLQNEYFFGSEWVGDNAGGGSPFDQASGPDPGIHLLFGRPRAFTHGLQQDDGPLTFPRLPNRWLVQRFGDDSITYRAWLIKSDAPTTDGSGVPWPLFPKDEQTPVQFNTIGNFVELTAPLAATDEVAQVNLTAVGQGNPLFSVYYPACRGVLGFHDPLTDVQNAASLSYLVTGWFSNSADDPLTTAAWVTEDISDEAKEDYRSKHKLPVGSDLTPEQEAELRAELCAAWFSERQWTCRVDPQAPPSRLIWHGLVRGISWQGTNWNYTQPSGSGSSLSGPEVFPLNTDDINLAYQVAIGNTGAEALAAGFVEGTVDQDVLTGLQEGLLGQPVDAAELQFELHARRFEGVQGGTSFAIQPEPEYSSSGNVAGPSAPAQSVVLPKPLAILLQDLNDAQANCDRQARQVDSCRWQVYALWYLWTAELRDNGVTARSTDLKTQLDKFKNVLINAKAALGTAITERNRIFASTTDGVSAGELVDELSKYPKTNADGSPMLSDQGTPVLKYRVVKSTAPPFYQPAEPVISISGPAMVRRYSAEASGPIACRVSDDIVTGIMLQVPGGSTGTVTSDALLGPLFSNQPDFQFVDGVNKSLLGEALLLDPNQASNIAGQVSQQSADELTAVVQALQDPTSTAAQTNPPALPNTLIGRLPDRLACFDWQRNPWIPIVMVWEVNWQSDFSTSPGQLMPDDLVMSNWKLDTSGDLFANDDTASAATVKYRGYSILSPSASISLAQQLQDLNATNPLVDALKNQNTLLQKLAGFNQALVCRQPGMQTPPLNYNAFGSADNWSFFIDPIRAFLNDGLAAAEQRDRFGPAPDTSGHPFFPIRSGQLTINRLSIVDAFGQTLTLPVASINQSRGTDDAKLCLAHSVAGSAPQGSAAALRPRFAQPMRVRFACANAPTQNFTPVCGWILPNYLEKSLAIYRADGQPLGTLQKKLGQVSGTSDPSAFYWVDLPGGSNGENGGKRPDDLNERLAQIIKDKHLRHFCSWVLSLNPDVGAGFSSLVSSALASADRRVPDDDPGVSVLVGRPLALVRASVNFEMDGLPAHQLELRAGTGAAVSDLIDTNGFEKVKWPLRLGDFNARNDGLIGLFKCVPADSGDDPVSSGPFYPSWGQDQNLPAGNAFAGQDFSVDCTQPFEVTMLLDPQARVHATTGVLPRTFFELPHENLIGAKRVREVFFQTAPVLGFSPTPAMPRPSDDYGEWSWAHRPAVTQWKLDPQLIEATYLGGFNNAWPTIAEGWLKLAIAPVKVLSFWIREPVEQVAEGVTRIHLAWSLQGAESLQLVKVETTGTKVEQQWDAPPFPGEYGVVIEAQTTYRLIATADDGKQDAKELIIKIADD